MIFLPHHNKISWIFQLWIKFEDQHDSLRQVSRWKLWNLVLQIRNPDLFAQNDFKRRFMLTSSRSREKLPSDLGNPFKLQRYFTLLTLNPQFFLNLAKQWFVYSKIELLFKDFCGNLNEFQKWRNPKWISNDLTCHDLTSYLEILETYSTKFPPIKKNNNRVTWCSFKKSEK